MLQGRRGALESNPATVAITIQDPCNRDFEWPFPGTPVPLGYDNYHPLCLDLFIAGEAARNLYWTFTGDAGVRDGGGFWDQPEAPSGKRVCLIRGHGAVSGVLPGLTAGKKYKLSFMAAQNTGNPVWPPGEQQAFAVFIDGQATATITPGGKIFAFKRFATPTFTARGDTVAIRIEGLDPTGLNHTGYIDALSVEADE